MQDFFEKLLRLVFPPKCIFCGKVLPIDTRVGICQGCFKMLPFMNVKVSLLDRRNTSKNYCDNVICVFRYDSIVRQAVVRYKFFGKSYYYRTLGRLLSEKIKKMTNFREFDIIISVPLYKARENLRGYNQALLLAKVVSRELSIPEQSRLLERLRNTGSQSLMPAYKRNTNVKGAFKVTDCNEVKNKVILLIDDVLTTGNTLNECSRVLKEAGAALVVAGVIATGRN
jgi:ComF family protein